MDGGAALDAPKLPNVGMATDATPPVDVKTPADEKPVGDAKPAVDAKVMTPPPPITPVNLGTADRYAILTKDKGHW